MEVEELPERKAWPAYLCATFVLLAIVLEFVGGRGGPALSSHGGRSVSPSTWPTAARTVWWAAVTVAAGGYSVLVYWIERKPVRYWVTLLTAAPFLFWTLGIATGQSWATFR